MSGHADVTEVPRAAEPHTVAKERLYAQTFGKWMPIVVRGFDGDVTYAEGFAGPGVYKGGEPGSPVIAMRALLQQENLREVAMRRPVRFLLVDQDERCTSLLRERLTIAANNVPPDQLRP